MPAKAARPCRSPGCPALVTEGYYCPTHRPKERARPSPAARGYDDRWRKIRARHLASEPLCRFCRAAGYIVAADEVDHIIPLAAGGTHDEDNLRSLCKSCHSRRTARDRGRRPQSLPGGL